MATVLNAPAIRQFNFSVNLLKSVIWQYDNSPNIVALLKAKQAWYDAEQTGFWQNWITDVFDLRTCNTFGLAVWAIILGFPLALVTAGTGTNTTPFGFGPDAIGGAANGNQNFFNSNFASAASEQFVPTTAQIRLLLQLRYRQLVSRGTVPEINKILADLLVPLYGPLYVQDPGDMSMRIVCVNGIPAFLSFLFTQFDLIPRPAGVRLVLVDGTQQSFGFGPDTIGGPLNGNLNFNFSNFTPTS